MSEPTLVERFGWFLGLRAISSAMYTVPAPKSRAAHSYLEEGVTFRLSVQLLLGKATGDDVQLYRRTPGTIGRFLTASGHSLSQSN
jgi:hypothetical protein